MRVPLSWLREHCDPGMGAEEIAERLDMTGTEVTRIERAGVPDPAGFVVGRVLAAERHPDADRLTVLEVDAGEAPRTIVCGAPNVAAGQTVAVALPGAVLPGGEALREAELRGVRSSGMVLAEDELELGEDHEGIIVLDDGVAPGTPLEQVLPIAEDVLELEITPNRPDCLGVYGVAREVHAATGAPLGEDPCAADAEPAGDDDVSAHASLEVDPDICLRFTARAFEGVQAGPSPLWLRSRLWAAGQRPISNVVDITNYVMLLTGQPLHAFDLDRVAGGGAIVVRRARASERMTTLDGVERELDESMALVCDPERPSGIAGIMGGQVSEVSGSTTRVLMEVATWVGPNILSTSKRLGLRSEASTRFEKQLHPDQAIAAQRLASRLMVELAGARLVPGTLDAYPSPNPVRQVMLRPARMRSLLGEEISAHDAASALERLGFEVAEAEQSLRVAVPGFRDADVEREADLIEEVARIHGLEAIPATLPARRAAVGRLTPHQRMRRRIEDALRDAGAHEIVAWSFTSAEKLAALRVEPAEALALTNPMSEDQGLMRPLLLPGLLDAARHNATHGRPDLALFESAHAYAPPPGGLGAPEGSPRGATPAREGHRIGALLTRSAPGAAAGGRPADFFAAKALAAAALEAIRVEWSAEARDDLPFLHPGRAARVLVEGGEVGWIGELHPLVLEAWGLPAAAALELDAEALAAALPGPPSYTVVSPFPPVFQDLAVVSPAGVPAAAVEDAIRSGGGELLGAVTLFDQYAGEQLGAGERSLAFRLEFRAPDRTLTDDEVAGLRAAIVAELEHIGGRLR